MCQSGDFTCRNDTVRKSIRRGKFEDENFIPKHTGTGILPMSNAEPNINSSKSICLAKMEWLDGKHCFKAWAFWNMEQLEYRNGKARKKVITGSPRTCVPQNHWAIPFKLRRAPPHLFTILSFHLTEVLWVPFVPYLPQSLEDFRVKFMIMNRN